LLPEEEVHLGELPEVGVDLFQEDEEHHAAAFRDREVPREEAASAHGDVEGTSLKELVRDQRVCFQGMRTAFRDTLEQTHHRRRYGQSRRGDVKILETYTVSAKS
jgi:hypothetical protein